MTAAQPHDGPSTPPVFAIPGASPELSARLADGLGRVEALLRETVAHEDGFIDEASGHLLAAGGKRFRPLLTLLAADACGGITDEVIRAAAGVELTHLASLYHDDVMDEADVRRGVVSANAAYGNSMAILVGDLLFGRASELIAHLGARAVLIQAQTFVRLCSGQIRDDRPCPPGQDPVQYYLGVLLDKTGVLSGTAAEYGAMFAATPGGSDAGEPQAGAVTMLREYGEKLGLVFQLADDLIDITSTTDESGKTPGTDLREGVDTLAVLFAKESRDPASARLRELLAGPMDDEDVVAQTLELLRSDDAVTKARARTLEVAREAQALVDPLPESDAKFALRSLAVALAERAG